MDLTHTLQVSLYEPSATNVRRANISSKYMCTNNYISLITLITEIESESEIQRGREPARERERERGAGRRQEHLC